MFLSNVDLAHRVARRFRQARTQERDHAIVCTIPPSFQGIPDDIVLQCSDGCAVTTADVEASLAKTMAIVPGSCRFYEVHADDETNGTRFEFVVDEGKKRRGLITINIVASAHKLTAYSLIELDVGSI